MPYPLRKARTEQLDGVPHANLEIQQLTELATRGLVPMFSAERQLFCRRLQESRDGLIREGLSHRYTMIALLGLHRRESAGASSPIEIRSVLRGLVQKTSWLNNIGDAGLLLWLCALALPERLGEVCRSVNLQNALSRFRDAREGRTTELAWFLSGLAHITLARAQDVPNVTELAEKTYQLLKRNQKGRGIFGHLARTKSPSGLLRGQIGSFADQVYPIYALTRFAQAYKVREALEMARGCGEAICRTQGPLGQWWWHYDSTTGDVFEQYPVYAVHQHGMAPMALFAIGDAAGVDFSEPVYRGVQWITGSNELARDFRNLSWNIIWRSAYHRDKYRRYLMGVRTLFGLGRREEPSDDLKIKCECRPYELGWLLYAFAGREA